MTQSPNPVTLADADLPHTDAAALERLKRFGGGKLLGEMITLFLLAAPERLGMAHEGRSAQDASAVAHALHSLKSSSAQLGALHMQRLCERGEALAKKGELGEIAALLEALDAELPRVRSWLENSRPSEAT